MPEISNARLQEIVNTYVNKHDGKVYGAPENAYELLAMARECLRTRTAEPIAWRVVCADGYCAKDHIIGVPSGQRTRMMFLTEAEAVQMRGFADDCTTCGPHRIDPLFTREAPDAQA